MPPRKRKVNYSLAGSGKKRAVAPVAAEPAYVRASLVAIDVTAGAGRGGLQVGDGVRIKGSGLYSGEDAIVEKFVGSAIPAALVRTTAGHTRHVRTIDLEPVTPSG
jgi:hypothetical protein